MAAHNLRLRKAHANAKRPGVCLYVPISDEIKDILKIKNILIIINLSVTLKDGYLSARHGGQPVVPREQRVEREVERDGRQHVPQVVRVVELQNAALVISET